MVIHGGGSDSDKPGVTVYVQSHLVNLTFI